LTLLENLEYENAQKCFNLRKLYGAYVSQYLNSSRAPSPLSYTSFTKIFCSKSTFLSDFNSKKDREHLLNFI